jgi:hypothetical protein
MRLSFILCGATIFLGSATALTATAAPVPFSDPITVPLVSNFSVSSPTQIPGEKLQPGDYSITVVDHLSDRIVLRIDGPEGKVHDTFLGVPNASLRSGGSPGPISWNAGSDHDGALRGFVFPGGGAVEFVYPKDEAVAIAKKNSGKVLAIDPASEGLAVRDKTLSQEDMAMVTLWTLTPTTVGPNDAAQPAIQAARYLPPQPAQPAQEVAQNEPPPPLPAPVQHAANVTRKPVVAKLPHTASNLPFIFVAGLFSLFSAALLSLGRRANDAA